MLGNARRVGTNGGSLSRVDRCGRPLPRRDLRLLGALAFRLRSGHHRPDGEAPRRGTCLPGLLVRPELHARRRVVAGRTALPGVRHVGDRAEAAAARHERRDRAICCLRGFVREVGLRPLTAVVPTLFFALPAAGTAARLVEANGGNVEPFLYVLLIWTLRPPAGLVRRGLRLGIPPSGVHALRLCSRCSSWSSCSGGTAGESARAIRTAGAARRLGVSVAVAAAVWMFVQWVKRFSSGAGPGTSLADVYRAQRQHHRARQSRLRRPAHGRERALQAGHGTLAGALRDACAEPLRDFGIVHGSQPGCPWSAGSCCSRQSR